MTLYAVFGASGFGREVMPIARQMLEKQNGLSYELVFIDDNPPAETVNGHRVLTYAQFLRSAAEEKFINIAIANSVTRQNIAEKHTADGIMSFSIMASNIVVMDSCAIGEGAILSPFVTITSNATIGKHFHANIYSYVAHDCMIGDYVTFAPSVKCNGNIRIEDHAYIGTGAMLRQGNSDRPLVIGRGAVVGMGAVVTKDVPAGATVVGNPARLLVKE